MQLVTTQNHSGRDTHTRPEHSTALGPLSLQGVGGIPRIEPMGERKYEPFALTDVQQAYWVGRQAGFHLGNIAAHGYMEVDCCALDVARLEWAFQQLIQRHDMLRAVINPDGRQQILRQTPDYMFQRYDLRTVSNPERTAHLDKVREEMSHQVLSPAVWPLFDIRASLLPDGVTRLHLSMDVLIFDALSFDLLSEELRHLYEGGASLPPLTFSYADYVVGLQRLEQSDLRRDSEAYWREKLRTLPPAPDLPVAKAPSSVVTPAFVRRSRRLGQHLWEALKDKARQMGVTPSVVLLTAYAYVLSRWSANKHFTLNLTLFNRLEFHPEVNDLVGDFTSILLLAIDFGEQLTFAERVQRVQAQLWQDMDHRFVSGIWVLREFAELKRDYAAAQMPVVFTSAMKPVAADMSSAAMSWLGEIVYTITQTPQVWLDHQITEDASCLVYDWDAVEELFPDGMLDDMFSAFGSLLETLACDETVWRQREWSVLPSHQQRLFHEVNATAAPAPTGLLHEPFLQQCQSTPENIAVIDSMGALTYRELYRRSNCLAHQLWRLGARSGELIGVLLPKCHQQVLAVLGILEAGAAYLPIEPSLSDDYVTTVLRMAGVTKVVTLTAVLRQRQLPSGITSIELDHLASDQHEITPLPAMQRPVDLAYIIYTSGSTGVPKGVMIDHRGALNTVVDINQRFGIMARDRVLSLSALNFDLSVYDIFGLLAVGGAVVIPDAQRLRDPKHWAELITSHRVTVWNTVPALMDIYVTYQREVVQQQDENLRLIMMSGDWIPLSLPPAIRTWCPQAESVSLGGATEASIWSILYSIDTIDPNWRSVPYGKAMVNQRFYVLDEHLQPRPIWTPGELYIGGVGVAQGYWRDDERTAASFIIHPDTRERLYRTGDLGRYLPDGNIEFLGRKDFQVKVNGYRVELGEIEAHMTSFPGVKSAVAALQGEPGQPKRLVGYYVREENDDESQTEREKLKFRLSEPGLRRFAEARERVKLLTDSRLTSKHSSTRRSQRWYPDAAVPRDALSHLLSHLSKTTSTGPSRYRYGSAGGLYPVQTYVFIKSARVSDITRGLYYYHPGNHELVLLSAEAAFDKSYFASENAGVINSAAFAFFLVANQEAIEPFYSDDSRAFCLLEAGLMAQLLEQEASACGIGLCQIGGFDFDRAEPEFQCDYRTLYLHCLVGGVLTNEENEPASRAPAPPPRDTHQQFEEHLQAHLKRKLPSYMAPTVYVRLDTLPLSVNGKVDRKALPSPQRAAASLTAMSVSATESGLAQRICSVWREVMNLEQVHATDNFFDLGGTSVDMIKIHTKLQPHLPKEISLLDMFFAFPTIAVLADHLQAGDGPRREKGRAPTINRRSLTSQLEKRRGAQRLNGATPEPKV